MRKLLSAALFFVVVGVVIAQTPEPKSAFDGLHLGLGDLSRLSRAKTRSISPENFTGE